MNIVLIGEGRADYFPEKETPKYNATAIHPYAHAIAAGVDGTISDVERKNLAEKITNALATQRQHSAAISVVFVSNYLGAALSKQLKERVEQE